MGEHQSTKPESIDGNSDTNSKSPTGSLSFGVGCWDFGIPCGPSQEFTSQDYVAILKERLENIASVNNLNITTLWEDEDAKADSQHAQETDDGMAIFGQAVVSRIDFDLYMPFRIQDDLVVLRERSDTGTEHFKIHALYVYYSPVVFVELVNPKKPCRPSTAMVVIRRYLQSELEKTHALAFRSVGPTPFHANFCIGSGPVRDKNVTFEHTTSDSRGYSRIAFRYRPDNTLANDRAAFEILMREIVHELDVYYFLQRQSAENYLRWNEVESLFSDIIDHSERMSWWQRIPSVHSQSRRVQELNTRLARFQATQVFDEYVIRKAFHETYGKGIPCYLRKYVEAEVKERPVFPSVPIADLLGFLERRRSKGLELLVILVAAIVGGIAGSLLTMLTGP